MACTRFIVSGRVQGVFFRASARREAERLGLNGHARNLADGSVEVVASGEEAALHELEVWLQHGPPPARVERVTRSDFDATAVSAGFHTL